MSRCLLRICLCSLLVLVFLLCSGTLLPQTTLYQVPVYEPDPVSGLRGREVGRVNLALNASFVDAQGNWRVVTGRWLSKPVPPEEEDDLRDELFASTAISDRSILGVSPGTLVPDPGGVNSCAASAGVAVDPLGRFVLTTNSAQNRVCVHFNDAETGVLTRVPGSPFSTGGTSVERIAVDPSGQFVFVTNAGSNNVTVFALNLDTGALSPVPGSPFPVGSQPLDVSTDGFGRFLYVANNLSEGV